MQNKPTSLLPSLTALLVVAALTLAPATSAAAPADRGHEGADPGPGCAPERPAVGHYAGGVIAETRRGQQQMPPIPCATRTGFRTSEVSIVVTNDGTVLFQPALATETGFPIGLLRSVDRGASWDFIANPNRPRLALGFGRASRPFPS